MSDQLLPCPFCGSYAEEGAASSELFYVGCTDCGATVYAQTQEVAAENWNARPDSKQEQNCKSFCKLYAEAQKTVEFWKERCRVCQNKYDDFLACERKEG